METVLGSYLEAVCVDSIESVSGLLDSLHVGTVTFFASNSGGSAAADRLSSRVKGPAGVASMLNNIIAVDSLSDALRARSQLAAGESVITRDGIWIGHDWLRVSRDKDVHAGVIEREQEMRQLNEQVSTLEQQRASLADELTTAREGLGQLEQRRDELQQDANRLHRLQSESAAQLSGLKTRAEQLSDRAQNLRADAEELSLEVDNTQNSLAVARERLDEGMAEMAEHDATRGELEARRDHLRQNVSLARSQAQTDRAAAQEKAIAVESKRSALNSIRAGLERMHAQLAQLTQRREELQTQLSGGEEPIALSAHWKGNGITSFD